MAWPQFIITGLGKLKDDYTRLNTYFSTIKSLWDGHVSGISDKHTGAAVTLDPTGKAKITAEEMQTAIDQIENEINQFVDVSANAEVGDAHISTVKGKTFADVRGRFEEIEQDHVTQVNEFSSFKSDTAQVAYIVRASGDTTGVTDTLNIQNALNTYKSVCIPDALYVVSKIIIKNGTSLVGNNNMSTVIKSVINNTQNSVIEFEYLFSYLNISNLKIDCNQQDVHGISSIDVPTEVDYFMSRALMSNIEVYGSTTDGINIGAKTRGKYKNISVHDCDGFGINYRSNDSFFQNLSIYLTGKAGLYLYRDNRVVDGKVYHSNLIDNGYAVILDAMNVVTGFQIEEVPTSGLYCDRYGNSFTGMFTGVGRINATIGNQDGTIENSLIGFGSGGMDNTIKAQYIRGEFGADIVWNLSDFGNTEVYNNVIELHEKRLITNSIYSRKRNFKDTITPHFSNHVVLNYENIDLGYTVNSIDMSAMTMTKNANITTATRTGDANAQNIHIEGTLSNLTPELGLVLVANIGTLFPDIKTQIINGTITTIHAQTSVKHELTNGVAECYLGLQVVDLTGVGGYTPNNYKALLNNKLDGEEVLRVTNQLACQKLKDNYATVNTAGGNLTILVRLMFTPTANNSISASSADLLFKNLKIGFA